MTYWYDIPPPAHGYWYDLETTVTKVLARLRLQVTDIDEPRIRDLVPVAAMMIDNELDRVNPMTNVSAAPPVTSPWASSAVSAWDGPTPTIIEGLIQLTVDLYTGVVPIGDDLGTVGTLILPHKSRFGFA